MSFKITKDQVDKVLKAIHGMAGQHALVGIPALKTTRKNDPIGNAAIGYIQERGSAAQNIPARPFLQPGVLAVRAQCADALKVSAVDALSYNTTAIVKGLNTAGLIAQASVKRTLKAGEGFAPLKPSTLAARRRKGVKGEKPLIRTGQLLNSITYVVRDR